VNFFGWGGIPHPPVFLARVNKTFGMMGLRDSRFGNLERVGKGFCLCEFECHEIRILFDSDGIRLERAD
jgi:hypothetical protein